MPAKAKKTPKSKGSEKNHAKATGPRAKAKQDDDGLGVDLAVLKKAALDAKVVRDKTAEEANSLREQAKRLEAAAKAAYIEAVSPYREACRKGGIECELAGGRAANRTPAIRFVVERVDGGGVKVAVKGRPETEEIISAETLAESIGKAAVAYVEKFIGDRDAVGNKQGSLGNRIRAKLRQ